MAQDNRGNCWSITINNPSSSDDEAIAVARQKGWRVEGQKEVGANGTPHFQLLVRTPQVRFSAVKKAFPRAHIELARNAEALKQYVHKVDTRESELKDQDNHYPSLQKVFDMWAKYLDRSYEYKELWIRNEILEWDEDDYLHSFDKACKSFILDGYVVESIAVNPQVRSSIKKFGYEIIHRSLNRENAMDTSTDSQTDRQPETLSESSSITQECQLPVMDTCVPPQ